LSAEDSVTVERKFLSVQAKGQEAFVKFFMEREASQCEKKPSVMEYLGLKKKVSNLQQIAHAMQMKVLSSQFNCTGRLSIVDQWQTSIVVAQN